MNSSPARSYETPAVVYEVNLLAHAGSSATSTPGCQGCPTFFGDLLDPNQGN